MLWEGTAGNGKRAGNGSYKESVGWHHLTAWKQGHEATESLYQLLCEEICGLRALILSPQDS